MKNSAVLFCLLSFLISCQLPVTSKIKVVTPAIPLKYIVNANSGFKTIHVFVALCDNKYQGIVKVPAKIGNGQDPDNNLYWGSGFGVRSFFKRSKDWRLIKTQHLDTLRLERLVFKHISKNYYLVADAYDGRYIKQAIQTFLYSCAGQMKDTLNVNSQQIGINGNARLLAYIGHDGLMEFELDDRFVPADRQIRDCMVLACTSNKYFAPLLAQTKANPVVWTSGLMCPEAYTLHDAIAGYVNGESVRQIRHRAVLAYDKYQKCGVPFAERLLVSGW